MRRRPAVLLLAGCLAAAALVAAVTVIRALRLPSRQLPAEPVTLPAVNLAAVAATLGRAISIPTISRDEEGGTADPEALAALRDLLAAEFPAVHATLTREVVGGGSLLYTWPGSEPSLDPLLLTGHLDVVPVDPGSAERWTHPPFSGAVAGGYVWGRGALDDKGGVVCLLAAVEGLLADGHRPRRTVLLFFGHDEERGGREGAARFAARLAREGVRPHLVLDEGTIIARGLFPGLDRPLALVRIAEKGSLTVELSAEAGGGHSSMPPRETAVGILARALARLAERPFPARLEGAAARTFETVAPELPFARRLVFANLWLFRSLVERQLAAAPSTDALLRTTIAPTRLEGSPKSNVLPARARAWVNLRLLPGDGEEAVLAHLRSAVDDPRVSLRVAEGTGDPGLPSDPDAPAFVAVHRAVRDVAPEAVVAPGLLVATTDARHYRPLVDRVYGFRPFEVGSQDLARFHGLDERVALEDLERGVRFFRRLLIRADA